MIMNVYKVQTGLWKFLIKNKSKLKCCTIICVFSQEACILNYKIYQLSISSLKGDPVIKLYLAS